MKCEKCGRRCYGQCLCGAGKTAGGMSTNGAGPRRKADKEARTHLHPHDALCGDGSKYTADETEFMLAMHDHLVRVGRYPTWDCRDVLAVAHGLGYRRTEEAKPVDGVFALLAEIKRQL